MDDTHTTINDKSEIIQKAKEDIVFFVENIIGFKLLPYQKRLLRLCDEARKTNKELVIMHSRLMGRQFLHKMMEEYEQFMSKY